MAEMTTREDRLRSAVVHRLARWAARLPAPEMASLDESCRVSDYLIELIDKGLKPIVNTSPSAAVRLSIEAQERGLRLDGASFLLGAEPVTPVRRTTIEACGAAVVPTYGTSECGWIGAQFPGARVADEVHIFRDAYAVVSRPDGRHSTSSSGRIRSCSRTFGQARQRCCSTRRSAIRPSSKPATGPDPRPSSATRCACTRSAASGRSRRGGQRCAQADFYRVLEEALPRRFGGALTDYQLVRADRRAWAAAIDAQGEPRSRRTVGGGGGGGAVVGDESAEALLRLHVHDNCTRRRPHH